MVAIAESQRKTRRRAMGRLLIRKASDLLILINGIENSPDKGFLDEKEIARLEKLIHQISVVGTHMEKMGTKLDGS